MKSVQRWVGVLSPVVMLSACLETGGLRVSKAPPPKTGNPSVDALLAPPADAPPLVEQGAGAIASSSPSPTPDISSSPTPDMSSSPTPEPSSAESGDPSAETVQASPDELLSTCIVGRWPGLPLSVLSQQLIPTQEGDPSTPGTLEGSPTLDLQFQGNGQGQIFSNGVTTNFEYFVSKQRVNLVLSLVLSDGQSLHPRMVFPAVCVANSLSLFVVRGTGDRTLNPTQFGWESIASEVHIPNEQGVVSYSHGYSSLFSPQDKSGLGAIKYLTHSVSEQGAPLVDAAASYEVYGVGSVSAQGLNQLTFGVRAYPQGPGSKHDVPFIYSNGFFGLYPIAKGK